MKLPVNTKNQVCNIKSLKIEFTLLLQYNRAAHKSVHRTIPQNTQPAVSNLGERERGKFEVPAMDSQTFIYTYINPFGLWLP